MEALEPLLTTAGFVISGEVDAVSSEGAICLFTWNNALHKRACDVVNKAVRQLVPSWFKYVVVSVFSLCGSSTRGLVARCLVCNAFSPGSDAWCYTRCLLGVPWGVLLAQRPCLSAWWKNRRGAWCLTRGG